MFHVLGKQPEDCDQARKPEVEDLYERWWLAFGSLLGRSSVRLGSDDDRAARLLRVYYNFGRTVLDTHHDVDEMGSNKHTERFDVMVQQCQDLIPLPTSSGEQRGQPFSFDVSLASPLNYVARDVARIYSQASSCNPEVRCQKFMELGTLCSCRIIPHGG